jgi:biotin carboxylase
MSRVVIIEPFSSAYSLIDRATALGHEALVVTADDGVRRIPAERLVHAHHVEIVDTSDTEAVIEAVGRLHAKEPIDAVLPGFEYCVPVAARISSALGLVGLAPDAAWRLRYKHAMRAALQAARVSQPDFVVVQDVGGVDAALAAVGLPAVVKPVDMAGSVGVRKVTSAAEADAAVEAVLRGCDVGIGRRSLPIALVEECIPGPEFSVEGFVERGQVRVLAFTAKLLGPEPNFVETAHLLPAPLSNAQQAEIVAYVTRAATVLGLTVGPFHAEVRLSPRGPQLMEIGARLPGDRIPDLLHLARGIDLRDIMIDCFLGRPVMVAESSGAARGHAGIRFFLRPGLARYHEAVVTEEIRADPRVRELAMIVDSGVEVPPPDSSFGRLGYALVTGDSFDEVRSLLDRVDASTTFR